MLRARRRSQAVVEFGIIALLFTLLLFAVIDFGLLLNTWLAVSSGSREIARSAAVGKKADFLKDEAIHLNLPSIDTRGFSNVCCGPTSAVEVRVDYMDTPTSTPYSPASQIVTDYPWQNVDTKASGCISGCHPQADDLVRVTVIAHGAQVITPLVRPFFGCTDGVNPDCHVDLHSTTIMRFEGQEF